MTPVLVSGRNVATSLAVQSRVSCMIRHNMLVLFASLCGFIFGLCRYQLDFYA